MDWRHGPYLLTDETARVDVDSLHRYLAEESYWSRGIARHVVETAVAHSLCFSLHHDEDGQVGFLRFATDRAIFAYLMDVYVLPAHRGRGLSNWMLGVALDHPDIHDLRRIMLATRDAHDLYARFGFTRVAGDPLLMVKPNPGANHARGRTVVDAVAAPHASTSH